MGSTFRDSRNTQDQVEEIGPISMPLRPLWEARKNPNRREQEFYGLYVTDVPQVGAFIDGSRSETPTRGEPLPEFVVLPGPIPDDAEQHAERRQVAVHPDAPTMAERAAARGVTMSEPSKEQLMPRYSQGATFAERAAIRRARNAAGILDAPHAGALRELRQRGPGELLEAPDQRRGPTAIAP